MILTCLNSDSSGNGYLLTGSKGQSLIIEAGISFMTVKKAIDYNTQNINGVIISHSHLDHAKYTLEYANAGIKCYSSKETFDNLGIKHHNLMPVQANFTTRIGDFTVGSFDLTHDVKNYGYLIKHEECGSVIFITDTFYCKYRFGKINHYLIEANHDQQIIEERLMNGSLNPAQWNRVAENHMSIETAKKLLLANDLSDTVSVTLLHLSDGNSNAKDFKKQIEEATGKPTYIADKGMIINLNVNSF